MGKMSSERRKGLFPLALGIGGDFVNGVASGPGLTGQGGVLCVHLPLCTSVKRLDHKRESTVLGHPP